MEFELIQETTRFFWFEVLVERFWFVGAEVVEHHPDAIGIRVVLINEILHERHPILRCPPIFDRNSSPPLEWFRREKEVFRALSFVMIVHTRDRARLCRARVADVCDQLDRMFVEAD